jgi:hypothetical protein
VIIISGKTMAIPYKRRLAVRVCTINAQIVIRYFSLSFFFFGEKRERAGSQKLYFNGFARSGGEGR